ncbi:hypothetical protein PCE1_000562 [Barthelona sp. PCE]
MVLKLCFVGDEKVGKTQIIRKLCGLEFKSSYSQTLDMETHSTMLGDNEVELHDICAEELAEDYVLCDYLSNVDCIIFCYDCSKLETFNSVKEIWIPSALGSLNALPPTQILLGLKLDESFTSKNAVSYTQVESYAVSNGFFFMHVSSKTNQNVSLLKRLLGVHITPTNYDNSVPEDPIVRALSTASLPEPKEILTPVSNVPTNTSQFRPAEVVDDQAFGSMDFSDTVSEFMSTGGVDTLSEQDISELKKIKHQENLRLSNPKLASRYNELNELLAQLTSPSPLRPIEGELHVSDLDMPMKKEVPMTPDRMSDRFDALDDLMLDSVPQTPQDLNGTFERYGTEGKNPSPVMTPRQRLFKQQLEKDEVRNSVLFELMLPAPANELVSVRVYDGDSAENVAEIVVKTFHLDSRITSRIATLIKQKLANTNIRLKEFYENSRTREMSYEQYVPTTPVGFRFHGEKFLASQKRKSSEPSARIEVQISNTKKGTIVLRANDSIEDIVNSFGKTYSLHPNKTAKLKKQLSGVLEQLKQQLNSSLLFEMDVDVRPNITHRLCIYEDNDPEEVIKLFSKEHGLNRRQYESLKVHVLDILDA